MNNLRKLMRLFFRQKMFIFLAAVFTTVQCAAQLYLPILMAQIVDFGIVKGEFDWITKNAVKMLITCFVLSISGYGARLLNAVGSERFALSLRSDLYSQIGELSVDDVAKFGTGSLITRLTADVQVCASFMGSLLQIAFMPLLLLIGGTVLVWRINARVGLIFLLFIVIQIILMLIFIRKTSPLFKRMFLLLDKLNTRLQETLSRLRLIKILTREPNEGESFDKVNNEFMLFGISVQKIVSVFQPIVMMIVDAVAAVILLFAARSPFRGGIRIGEIMQTISYAQQVLLSIVITGRLFQLMSQALPSASRLCEVINKESSLIDGEKPINKTVKTLEMKGVSLKYPVSGEVLHNITINFNQGEFVAFVGPTGCGKSSLASLCARLRDASEGCALLNATDIKEFRLDDVRRHIALVEKDTGIFAGTFRDNVIFGRDYISETDVQKACEAAQCLALIESLPDGYDSEISSVGRALSGGERQRLAIARALAGSPDILLLDDCTSSLDYETEASLLRDVRHIYPDLTVLLFTHRTLSAKKAECIYYIENGQIIDSGNDEALKQSCFAYRSLCAAGEGAKL